MPLRILHVTPYFRDAWAYGGIPRAAAALADGLVERGHHVTVCTTDACLPRRRLSACERLGDGQIRLRVFPNVSNGLAYRLQFFTPMGLRGFLSGHAHEFDLAHLHGCHHLPGSTTARVLQRTGTPYVVQPHGTAPVIERRRLAKRMFDATLGRNVLTRARSIVAVTDAERRQLIDLGLDDRSIAVVPNALPMEEFERLPPKGAVRHRLGLGSGPLVAYLGKLTPRKRADVLVRAFARLDSPNPRLLIAGNDMGAWRGIHREIRRFGLERQTIRLGLLTGPERLELLVDADVVAYPAEHEIFGLVPLEALMCGTPVVVADDSGCAEVISRTGGGLAVPVGDPGALASAIAQILSDAAGWAHRAERARKDVQSTYNCARVSARMEDVYRAVMGDEP